MKNFITVNAYSEKYGISIQRVQKLCRDGRIPGAEKIGGGVTCQWIIPANARDPRRPVGQPPKKKGRRK